MKLRERLMSTLTMLTVAIVLTGCASTKDVAYFQNRDEYKGDTSQPLYDARIMPKDILTITVSTTEPEAAVPFNMTVPTTVSAGLSKSSTSHPVLQSYLVDNNGDIEFPIIGKLHLGGLTKSQAEKLVHDKITPYMNANENPIVTVRMANYQISVIGEVGHPGMYSVSNEKINVLEALAKAGDLGIHGVRNNVQLIREDAQGRKTFHTLDLNDANIVNSPYYYLQQNDILYVEPNKVKAQNSNVGATTSLWFSGTSILISLTSLLYNILK